MLVERVSERVNNCDGHSASIDSSQPLTLFVAFSLYVRSHYNATVHYKTCIHRTLPFLVALGCQTNAVLIHQIDQPSAEQTHTNENQENITKT